MEPELLHSYRFTSELEFVQSLSNVGYLHHLACNKYFEDPRFVKYLSYLLYWKTQPYILYITYPQCLVVLDLLQDENFRASCSNVLALESLRFHQIQTWRNHQTLHELDNGSLEVSESNEIDPMQD
ncbi:hypothetical protein GEMRC1_013473 [Eukaryota sp. GEM-RC1]